MKEKKMAEKSMVHLVLSIVLAGISFVLRAQQQSGEQRQIPRLVELAAHVVGKKCLEERNYATNALSIMPQELKEVVRDSLVAAQADILSTAALFSWASLRCLTLNNLNTMVIGVPLDSNGDTFIWSTSMGLRGFTWDEKGVTKEHIKSLACHPMHASIVAILTDVPAYRVLIFDVDKECATHYPDEGQTFKAVLWDPTGKQLMLISDTDVCTYASTNPVKPHETCMTKTLIFPRLVKKALWSPSGKSILVHHSDTHIPQDKLIFIAADTFDYSRQIGYFPSLVSFDWEQEDKSIIIAQQDKILTVTYTDDDGNFIQGAMQRATHYTAPLGTVINGFLQLNARYLLISLSTYSLVFDRQEKRSRPLTLALVAETMQLSCDKRYMYDHGASGSIFDLKYFTGNCSLAELLAYLNDLNPSQVSQDTA